MPAVFLSVSAHAPCHQALSGSDCPCHPQSHSMRSSASFKALCAGTGPAAAPSKMFEPSRPSTRSRLPPGAEPPEPPKPSKNSRRRGKGKGSGAAAAGEASAAEDVAVAEQASSTAGREPQGSGAPAPGDWMPWTAGAFAWIVLLLCLGAVMLHLVSLRLQGSIAGYYSLHGSSVGVLGMEPVLHSSPPLPLGCICQLHAQLCSAGSHDLASRKRTMRQHLYGNAVQSLPQTAAGHHRKRAMMLATWPNEKGLSKRNCGSWSSCVTRTRQACLTIRSRSLLVRHSWLQSLKPCPRASTLCFYRCSPSIAMLQVPYILSAMIATAVWGTHSIHAQPLGLIRHGLSQAPAAELSSTTTVSNDADKASLLNT